jgi:hypothetical protein
VQDPEGNEKFTYQVILVNGFIELSGNPSGHQQLNKLNEKGVHGATPEFRFQGTRLAFFRVTPCRVSPRGFAEHTGTIVESYTNCEYQTIAFWS